MASFVSLRVLRVNAPAYQTRARHPETPTADHDQGLGIGQGRTNVEMQFITSISFD